MTEIGYALSSEENGANDLIRYARRAEEVGFGFVMLSDHFHPWTDKQGQSPFAWTVLGGIAQATKTVKVGTGVTCPTFRYSPAIIGQAAATVATMMPGRFFLGLGSGENLNEHIIGQGWPRAAIRLDMLEEAVDIIRLLWEGGLKSHEGDFFIVENARIYSLPDEPPEIFIAASGKEAAELAGRIGDGLISTAPKKEIVQTFQSSAGRRKSTIGQLTVCWAKDEKQAVKTAFESWPNAALKGELSQDLPLPGHFEQACRLAREEDVAEEIICGPDRNRHLDIIAKYVDAGFDSVIVHQVGPDQEGFFEFYSREVIPEFKKEQAHARNR